MYGFDHKCPSVRRAVPRTAAGGRISVGWAGVRRYIRQNWSQDRPLQGQEGAIPTGLGHLERAPARQTFDSRQ